MLNELGRMQLPAIEESSRAMDILLPFDSGFKEKVVRWGFRSPEDEVAYFRHQRPQLMAHLLFHSKRYHIELAKPAGSVQDVHAYYRGKLKKIDSFFEENRRGMTAFRKSGR